MKLKLVVLLLLSLGFFAQAQQGALLERNFAGVSKETNPQAAKKDIQDQAASKISEDVIKDLIGEDRYAKNRTLIQNKVIKNSERHGPCGFALGQLGGSQPNENLSLVATQR